MALSVTSAPWQNVAEPALDLRRQLGVGLQEGVVGATDMAVAQRAAGANFSVDIAAGEALIQGDTVTNQGRYYAYNDAVVNLTGFTAAHATLPRIDRVTLRVRDTFHDGSGSNDVAFVIVTGTATSGATLANLTGAASVPTNQLLLANVLIPATATTITTANIDTTVRTRAASFAGSAAFGGFLTISASNTDLAWAGASARQVFANILTGGGTLRSLGAPLEAGTRFTLRNSNVAITVLHQTAGGTGVQFYLRDLQNVFLAANQILEFVYDGSNWVEVGRDITPPGYELDYVQVTSSPTSTATSAATATALITGNAVTYDGGTSVIVELFIPSITNSGANQVANFNLYDGSTDLGQIARTWSTTSGGGNMIVTGKRRLSPTAAAHTYSIRAWNSAAGTITAVCGVGGAGVDLPMFLRVTRAF